MIGAGVRRVTECDPAHSVTQAVTVHDTMTAVDRTPPDDYVTKKAMYKSFVTPFLCSFIQSRVTSS